MSCPFYHSKNYMSTYIPGIFPGVYLGSAHESSTEKTGSYCSLSKWDDPLGLDQLGVDESHSFFWPLNSTSTWNHLLPESGWWFQPLWIWVRQLGWWNSQYDGKVIQIPWFQSPPTSHSYSITRGLITIKSPLNHQQPTRVYWSHKSGAPRLSEIGFETKRAWDLRCRVSRWGPGLR